MICTKKRREAGEALKGIVSGLQASIWEGKALKGAKRDSHTTAYFA